MRPIRLPELPDAPVGLSGAFDGDVRTVIRRAVVIGNGSPGSENQSIGLIHALSMFEKHRLYRVTRPKGGINDWLHWLPVTFHKKLDYVIRLICIYTRRVISKQGLAATSAFSENGAHLGLASVPEVDVNQIVSTARNTYEREGPLLVVACGRDTVSIASSIKRLASKHVFLIQIKLPRSKLSSFDLIITPRHDYFPLTPEAQEQVPRILRRWITPREPPDSHVVLTLGALHQIDFATLRAAANAWRDELASTPKPLVAVNIGGPTRLCRYGADLAKELVSCLLNVIASCGSIAINFSSRTPQKVSLTIIKELSCHPIVTIWDGKGKNPYTGHLAWADAFVITADSVSMISEGCSTGKPVYIIGSERCTWKLMDFHRSLRERGMIRQFTGLEDMSESWSYSPLNDTAEAARRVQEALAERGLRLQS